MRRQPVITQLRSPVIFWLLVAATLAVDVLVFSRPRYPERFLGLTQVVPFALITGQFSVVCLWSALGGSGSRHTILSFAAIVAAVLVVTLAMTLAFANSVKSMFTYFALHAALVWIAVKVVQRTSFWQRRTGQTVGWNFSMMQLLVAMTVVAVLSATVANSEELTQTGETGDWLLNLAFVVGTACVSIASLVFWGLSIHWLLRLAASLGCALLVSLSFALLGMSYVPSILVLAAFYLIQALAISVWLGIGPIIPHAGPLGDGISPAQGAPAGKE
jgi:hypothetical protein